MTDVAPNLVIEDDGVQHFMGADGLNVYSPEYGTMHAAKSSKGGWALKHAYGFLSAGFFDSVGHGSTVAEALARCRAMPQGPDAAMKRFGKRVEKWYRDGK